MDRQHVLQQFAQKNGLTSSDAAEILIESGWDVGRAEQLFHQLHKAGQINSFKPTNRTSHAFPNNTIHDRIPGHWGNPVGGGQAGKPVERIIPIHVDGRPNPINPVNRPMSDITTLRSVGESKPKVSEFSKTNLQGNYSQPLKSQVPNRQEGIPNRHEGVPIKQGGVTVKQEGPVAKFPVSQFSQTVGNPSAIPPAQREQRLNYDSKQKDPIRTTVSASSAGTSTGNKVDGSSQSLTSASSATTKPSTPSSPRPLKRGISKIVENESLVSAARSDLLHDIEEDHHDNIYTQTFILPDLTIYSADYRAFLEKDLIETSTLVSLEQAGRLNWWAEMGICQRLLPMATTGDGNCLLHAASLAMLGIHDRQLMLRKALFDTLTNKNYKMALYRRWRFQQTLVNQQSGLILSEDEWQKEWNGILKLASTTPRALPGDTNRRNSGCCDSPVTQSEKNSSSPVVYESLEEFHVFVLAHVLQRVIIVVADTMLKDCSGEALAPIPFGGIYLPLEINPKNCYRSPLLLTYDAAHFSALVPMDVNPFNDDKTSLPVAIPVVGPDLNILPLHFDVDPGVNYDWNLNKSNPQIQTNFTVDAKLNLLKKYLDLDKLLITGLDSDNDSDIDRKSSGSYESDDNVACIAKDKKKEGKVSQQIQSMSKQFGSLGKSMGKKIKKNFGSVGKALKAMGPDNGKSRRSSVGSGLTQSTKLPLTIAAIAEQEQNYVWCAKIKTKKADTQVKMIDNYLQDTKQRFEEDRAIWKAQGEEIRRRSVENFGDMCKNAPCVTTGCKMYGKPETSYLCSKCFSEQKQQLLQKQNSLGKYETYPGRGSRCPDDVQTYGKSKFYIGCEASEDQFLPSNPVSRPVPVQHLVASSQSDRNNPQSVDPQTRNRAHSFGARNRTPSPDYDNVEYTKKTAPVLSKDSKIQGGISNTNPAGSTSTPLICRNPGCDFYGSASTDNLCSACYKSKQRKSSESQQKTRL